RIDATGLVVSPGFIDIQSGTNFLGDGRSVSKVTQGITTEILGEGSTPAPTNEKTAAGGNFATGGPRGTGAYSGPHGFGAWLDAIDEAIRIGTQGHVPVEIYHLKAAGTKNWSKGPLAIAKIDSARRAGVDIQANMYAYVAGGTGLSACTPPWASENGKLIDNLQNTDVRARIRTEMLSDQTSWENLCFLATPENVLLLGLRQ